MPAESFKFEMCVAGQAHFAVLGRRSETMALDQLEAILKKQWRLGQSIVLCFAFDPNDLLTIVIPHYFAGNFTSPNQPSGEGQNNEDFIRQLISGSCFKAHNEICENAGRLGVAPSLIKLDSQLDTGEASIEMTDEMIKRYSVGREERRAVTLFDIELQALPLALGMRNRL